MGKLGKETDRYIFAGLFISLGKISMTAETRPLVVSLDQVESYEGTCGDVRELLNPDKVNLENLSVAHIEVRVGKKATPHYHKETEEIYYILSGSGEVRVGDASWEVSEGDSIAIPPESIHTVENVGEEVIYLLAINSPPYDSDDTYETNQS